MIFSVSASAGDWPATLYMGQSSFSSTGRLTATGNDGVYVFNLKFTSATTAPKYYIFTSASSATNAKKGTYKIFGASPIADGSCVQAEYGKTYPLYDISTAEEATALIAAPTTCSFLPLYWLGSDYTITVNLNDQTVSFNLDTPTPAISQLGIFAKGTKEPLGIATVTDGIARYSVKIAADSKAYFAANASLLAETNSTPIWGSSTQLSPTNVDVTAGKTYPLVPTTYYQVYSQLNCSFDIPAGMYDIIADLNTGKVEFADYTGAYVAKPATLYMRSYAYGSTAYGSATGEDGVYTMTFDKSTSTTTDPFMAIFTEATSLSKAPSAIWNLGATTDDANVVPVYGKTYPLVFIDPNKVSSEKTGTFMPLYPQKYSVVADLNNMTVTFNPVEEVSDLTSICLLDESLKLIGEAQKGTDNKYHFSVKRDEGTKIMFSTAENATQMKLPAALNFGAGDHANPVNITTDYNGTYTAGPMTYRRVYSDKLGFFEIPGNCDIAFDPATGEVNVTPYTGAYLSKPAVLNMRSNNFGTNYGTATGENGVYTFSFDKSGSYTAEPIYALFSDVTSLANARTASWVLGATTDDTNIVPVYGKTYPLVFIDPDKASNDKTGLFMPLYPEKYNIVVDLNNMTVAFNPVEAVAPLSTLYILNESLKMAATADKSDDGKFRYSVRGAEGTKIMFSTASSGAEMKAPGILNYGAGDHGAPLNLRMEYGKKYIAGPMSYRRVYTDKLGFFEIPGKCDIVFDPATGELNVTQYSGAYETLPEKLYLKINTVSSTNYADATGVDGIYTFEYSSQGATTAPRFMLFCDATSYSGINPASWVLGASEDGSIVAPAPGDVTPLYDIDATQAYNSQKGCFLPFYPHTYTITLDLKNRTVKWGEPASIPARINLLDNGYAVRGTSGADDNGVFTIETVTYSSHPVVISEADNLTNLRTTKWIYTAGPYNEGRDIDIADGMAAPAYRSTSYHVHYNGYGFWTTPEGRNKIKLTLDTKDNTATWAVTPYPIRPTEVMYMINRDLEPIAQVVGDNSGIFEFSVDLKSSEYVGFSDSATDKGDPERVFFGSGVPYSASRITPQTGKEYSFHVTSPDVITANNATFYLTKGLWRIRVNLNDNTIVFTDNSRGGTWYTPEAITLCDDDLNVLATAESAGEGVFTFNGVTVSDEKPLTKVVVRDAAENGAIFGANANGEIGPTAVSSTVYDLYMPKELWVVTDGASCFGLTPATYNITVDFNAKTIVFVDPTVPVYPTKMTMMTADDEPESLGAVSQQSGVYTFSLDNAAEIQVFFTDSDGATYGSAIESPTVENGAVLTAVTADEPIAFAIPEGLWTVEFSLADMTVKFTQAARPVFVSSTLPEGADFYSYFGTGTDPKAVFTFNNPIYSINNLWVVLGDYQGGTPVESETTTLGLRTASVVDNTIVVGFNGQHYTIPEGAEPKVHIVISTIVDQNRQTLVCDPVNGLPAGSMVFEYPFKEFERIAIDGQCDLEDGENIDETPAVTVRINHFSNIDFDDIVFATREAKPVEETPEAEEKPAGEPETQAEEPAEEYIYTVVSPTRWTAGETDENGYTPVTVQVPMAARGLGDIYLYLSGLDIDDGYTDHEFDIVKSFNTVVDPTVQVSVTPDEGTAMPALDRIEVRWTHPLIESVGNLSPDVSIVDEAVNDETPGEVAKAEFSYTLDDKTLTIAPTSAVETKGTYLFMFKEGDIVFNDDPESVNKPFALMYTVDPSLSGIRQITITDDDDVEVYNLSGILLRRGKGASVIEGLKGFYIVNGVKCYLGAPLR